MKHLQAETPINNTGQAAAEFEYPAAKSKDHGDHPVHAASLC
jgi:hypothetical protein